VFYSLLPHGDPNLLNFVTGFTVLVPVCRLALFVAISDHITTRTKLQRRFAQPGTRVGSTLVRRDDAQRAGAGGVGGEGTTAGADATSRSTYSLNKSATLTGDEFPTSLMCTALLPIKRNCPKKRHFSRVLVCYYTSYRYHFQKYFMSQ
jgi:hypothetical protein